MTRPASRAALLAIGVGAALAATATSVVAAAPKPSGTRVTCDVAAVTAIPNGHTSVAPPVQQGRQYGHVGCGRPLGVGVEANAFKRMPSDDLQGPFRQYFAQGTIRGVFDLAPDAGLPPSPTTFNSESYAGTLRVLGGTGAYRQARGQGTVKCLSVDGVHFRCTQKLALTGVG
jgi:hypothetical protein